jgi:hypothetical protein
MLENAADRIEDKTEDKIAGLAEEIPAIKEDTKATKQKMRNMDYPNLKPLRKLVEGSLSHLSCLVYHTDNWFYQAVNCLNVHFS